MADQAELSFVKLHLANIGVLPVQFPDDSQQPPHNSLKKLPIIPIDLPPPPPRKDVTEATSSGSIDLTFKVTKPAQTFSLSVSLTDPISSIKAQLATQPRAPPADAQRLLLRGKALADGKLLKEYPVKSGDSITLMLKPGFEWSWSEQKPTDGKPSEMQSQSGSPKDKEGDVQMILDPEGDGPGGRRGRHGRIPSVVLSPSPSSSSLQLDNRPPSPIFLNVDTSNIPSPDQTAIQDAYQRKISTTAFWEKLHEFLKTEFEKLEDADRAWEAFLVGSKGSLSPSEIARIRDTIGIHGMGGR